MTSSEGGRDGLMLKVEDLSFSYRSLKHGHVQVLDNIDLEVRTGEFVSLLGAVRLREEHALLDLVRKLPRAGSTVPYAGAVLIHAAEGPVAALEDHTWQRRTGNRPERRGRRGGKSEAMRLIPVFGLSGFEGYLPSDLSEA